MMRPVRPHFRWALAAAAAFAVVSGGLGVWLREPGSVAVRLPAAPSYEIAGAPGAEWETVERGPELRLRARAGRIELAVAPLRAGQRFEVELPDGELDVRGTRFSVEVDRAHTREVRVSEGQVELRMQGAAPILLAAGERWSARVLEAAVPVTPPEPLRAARPERKVRPRPGRPSAFDPGHEPAAVSGAQTEPARSPGADFAAAMAAFSAGDYRRASARFRDFAEVHADDARAEDAMFLRAVALSRGGDRTASRAAARAFLERHPSGLRRREAEALARD